MKLLRAKTSLCKLYIQICFDNAMHKADTALMISRTMLGVEKEGGEGGGREVVGTLATDSFEDVSTDSDLLLSAASAKEREKNMEARKIVLAQAAPNAHDIMLMR